MIIMQTKEIIEFPVVLQSVLQTILFSVGLFFIFKLVYAKNKMCGTLAFLGLILITLGGTFKVLQLISIAADAGDKPSLGNSLLVFLSAGLIFFVFALRRSGRRDEAMNLSHVWTFPLFLVAVVWAVAGYIGLFTHGKAWFYILLGVAALANIVLILQLLGRSLKPSPVWLAVGLFIVNLIVILSFYKSMNPDSGLQEFNQLLLTCGQASFAGASWLLLKKEL
jgi:uncharacterized membrane protein